MNLILKKFVYDYFKNNVGFLIFYTLTVCCTWPAEALLLSNQYSNLITSLKKPVSINNLFNFKENIKEKNIFGITTLIFLIWLLLIFFYGVKHTLEEKLYPDYLGYIRLTLINGIMESSSHNFKELKSGELITIVNELSNVFLHLLDRWCSKLFPNILGIILINIYYFYNDLSLGFLYTLLIIIRLYYTIANGFQYAEVCGIRDKKYFDMNESFNDLFNNMMNVHINNEQKTEKKKQGAINDDYNESQEEEMRTRKNISMIANLITVVCFIIILIYSFILYKKMKISLGLLITITFIEIKLVGTFLENDTTILTFFQKLGTLYATKDFLRDVLNNDEQINKCKIKNNNIIIKNLSFKYKKDYVFKDLNLSIKSGERIGIVGRSGSGKTTLMKLLIGLHKPTSGNIFIGNCNINNINNDELRDHVNYINQRTSLFNDTIIKNIKYGNIGVSNNKIDTFIKKYGLDSVYSKLNDGIYSNAGVNGANLSLGMQKVTLVLRGIFKKGNILIMDEPLTGLDKNTKEKVINMINDLPRSKTIIIITHDKEILQHLDNVYDLNNLHKGITKE